MLISLSEALSYAETHGGGLAAVNTPFFEALLATIDVGERAGVPIVLAFAQSHEKYVSIEEIGPAMVALASRSEAPFVVHVDHGEDIEYIRTGLDIGFTSAMIDGSLRPYEENVALTRAVVEMAHERGADVEGEIGAMSGNENGDPSQGIADETLYTRPQEAADFVARTGVDCLAASFGTVHGLYRREPRLDYELIEQLRRAAGVPLVMHGGSGLKPQEYRACIDRGVRKINYYTYAAKAALDAARDALEGEDTYVFSDVAVRARQGVREDVGRFVQALAPRAGAL
ncbi:class II fructose-bisphosphate aldolase [Brachybacterium huguangmaarense]|uniref:Class II fructose-bisphosphate aldolase n=1 Tax=Brachybacterium huguangmaarense TaxID=1652028 RepID=A0ABY6G2Y9_9MICO|nr:class II fructose-bisphosphate aldolase [Brachybacterium huguangmaarense]UYG17583.1 class II fructose-bisphosphate aldolase [Brachybacterium huguangmaarense]